MVYLVGLVYLVSFVQPDRPNRPERRDRPNKPDRPNNGLLTLADFFSILLGAGVDRYAYAANLNNDGFLGGRRWCHRD